jgi:parkin
LIDHNQPLITISLCLQLQGFHIGDCAQDPLLLGTGAAGSSSSGQSFANDVLRSRWHDLNTGDGVDPSALTIRLVTKPCPKCHTPTERDGGCMHMVCTKAGCGFQWCWVCQIEWTRDCMASHWFG